MSKATRLRAAIDFMKELDDTLANAWHSRSDVERLQHSEKLLAAYWDKVNPHKEVKD